MEFKCDFHFWLVYTFKICGIRTVVGLVVSAYMSFLQLVDMEQWFLTRGARLSRVGVNESSGVHAPLRALQHKKFDQ